jgi:sRNA-binding carbon storage regulator CsrA
MLTLKPKVGESIVLTIDGHEILISLTDISPGAVKLKIQADEAVKISHRSIQDEFVD